MERKTMLATMAVCGILLFVFSPNFNHQIRVSDNHVALFVFGDSLYDGGMNLYAGKVGGDKADYLPYGETFFNHPAGRFSDGRLIPDFIAQFGNLPFPPPYLLPELKDFTNGINFATGGACVISENRPDNETIHLKTQIDYFVQMVQKLKQQLGKAEAKKLVSKAVYMFHFGANDYAIFLNRYHQKPASPDHKRLYVNHILGNLTTHIMTLYNQGGRKFAFQGMAPFSCLPSIKFKLGFTGSRATEPSDMAKMHNAALLTTAKKMESQLPGFKYSVYDFFSSLLDRYNNGNTYGFNETNIACCGSGVFNGDRCTKNRSGLSVCNNPNDYLWFDSSHPTDKANQQFAQEFWSGSANIVAPYNIRSLFNMH